MLSLLATTEAGRTIEVGMIGNEGMAGLPSILRNGVAPYQVMVQLHLHAFRVSGAVLREAFRRGGRLQDLLLRYVNTLLIQLAQSSACNRFHSVEERLCRWLLICHDRVQTDTIPLTQEFISHMLGAPRSSITVVASALQDKRAIRYSRGKITVVDRQQLKAGACECYDLVRKEFTQFLVA
jgi:CRP-like cAMP-binding protein